MKQNRNQQNSDTIEAPTRGGNESPEKEKKRKMEQEK